MKQLFFILLILCISITGCQNKKTQTQVKTEETTLSNVTLPSDFKFVVTETKENPGSESISIFVEINKKLSNEQLKFLSDKIKSDQKFTRVFIGYTLPQNSSGIVWANVEYNPTYKLEINGNSLEDEKQINSKKAKIDGDIKGEWYEEEYTSSTIVLYKRNNKSYLGTFKKRFGSDEIDFNEVQITESKHSQGTKLSYKNEHGEYYVLSSDKQRFMFFNSENKCFTTALPISSDTFDSEGSVRNKPLEIKGNTAAAYTKKEASKDMSRKVYIIVQEFIKQNLEYPDKTKFSDNYSVEDIGNNQYYIVLPIVAENRVGQKNNITCKFKLKFNGGAWEDYKNWTVIEQEM